MNKRSLITLAASTLSALGVTFVPAGGFLLWGWSPATVMVLYLLEPPGAFQFRGVVHAGGLCNRCSDLQSPDLPQV